MHKNQLINFRSVIYNLKRDYGFRLDLYRKTEVVNLETGKKVTTRQKFKIKKGILLPNLAYRDFNYGTIIKGGTNLQVGGLFDLKQRVIVIDRRELPRGFEINVNDYIVFNHDRYELKDVTELELANFYRLTIRQVEGDNPNEVHEQIVNQYLTFSEFLDNGPFDEFRKIIDVVFFTDSWTKQKVSNIQLKQKLLLNDGIGEIR